ncbi:MULTISPECIES: helix-turn-helix domain-containing protein [unclassified Microbacterium]|uniref:helix-turn-helix domain-containing protein n=1 Tax=unclassified Microbacterium TaxID=2609290 RepID=UPI003010260F
MSERVCIRGCARKGEHLAVCLNADGEPTAGCTGCVPFDAADGVLLCERCFRTLRRHLEDAADLVAHLRSVADPTKAVVLDRVRVSSSMPELPAPVAADLVDASNDITQNLNAWANWCAGEDRAAVGLHAGADAAEAHDVVRMAADVVLDELEHLANDSHQVLALCEDAIVVHHGEPSVWSIADAAVRWPLDDQPRWASAPCPECDLMAVRVQPSRGSRPTRYRCTAAECGWEANELDDGGLWAAVFAEPTPPEIRPHDPDLLTLTEAARAAGRTVGTIRTWIRDGHLERMDGRVRRDDVLAVKAMKEGAAA